MNPQYEHFSEIGIGAFQEAFSKSSLHKVSKRLQSYLAKLKE